MSSDPIEHGGDLSAARRRYGVPDGGWIDLSTGINAIAYPLPELPADAWTQLPGAAASRTFIQAAAMAYCARESTILPLPGAQAGIVALGRALNGYGADELGLNGDKPTVYLAPTYGEYARCFARAKPVEDLFAIRRALDAGGVAILCNPNNPDGRALAPGEMLALADRAERRGGWLIVDEAFVDIAPELSICGRAGHSGLLILRSFGKFYGLAGVRLGALLGPPKMLGVIERDLGPWPVSGPALAIGQAALLDEEWAKATRHRLQADGRWLGDRLERAGYRVIGKAGLFMLIACEDGRDLQEYLARRGIWTRVFKDHPKWLRFGLPGSADHWRRLSEALELEVSS